MRPKIGAGGYKQDAVEMDHDSSVKILNWPVIETTGFIGEVEE